MKNPNATPATSATTPTRIPNQIVKGNYKTEGAPEKFKLGKGHVKFFYDKLLFLKERYQLLQTECEHRGFDVTYKFPDLQVDELLLKCLIKDVNYKPTKEDITLSRYRIHTSLMRMWQKKKQHQPRWS